MRAASISRTCGWFLRSYMRSYMFTYMLRIFISKSEGVGCDVVVLWIFLWCFSGFLLAFCLLWNDMVIYMVAYCFITKTSVPPEALVSLFDSCKSLVLIKSLCFFLRTCYYLLLYPISKAKTFDTHTFYEIDTNPITHSIDAHRRWILIPVLSHIPCGWTWAPCLLICAYTSHTLRNISNKNTKILSFYID